MSSTPKLSSNRNSSVVFVQVPASPFDLERYQSLPSRHVPASNNSSNPLKENTPLRAPRVQMLQSASSSSSSLKRKLSASSVLELDVAHSTSKKVKSASTGNPLKLSQINSPTRVQEPPSNACPEYPNGWTYCHQCCKKRDLAATIHCTLLEEKHVGKGNTFKQRQCISKYCRACLQNRYGEELEALRNNKKWETGHVENAGYTFKCPKCRDVCNCPRCRKSKGLDPIGTMRKSETTSVKKEKPVKTQSANPQPKKRVRKSKPKTLPAVKWTRIAPELSHSEVQERMHIREFILRFNHLSDSGLLKPQLEELEQINGKYAGQEGLDPASWVSDACLKSIVLMLLDILSGVDSPYTQASQIAVKTLKNVGFSLSKVWSVLVEWKESILETIQVTQSDEEPAINPFHLTEPLPPSDYFYAQARRSTRNMTSTTSTSVVVHTSAQLIPVVLSLIDLTLQLPSIKEALEEGPKEAKEVIRKAREALKIEGERWDVVRKRHEQTKDKDKAGFQDARRLHKQIVSALESSVVIAQCEAMQRFSPLGSDPEGRVFYALSPGHAEREAAYEFAEVLSSEQSNKSKLKKKGRTLKLGEREVLHDWSWMILVWGKKPPSAYTFPMVDENGDGEDAEMDEDAEAWWCFSDPNDIKELAEWLSLDNDLGESANSTSPDPEQASLKQLVSVLKDFGSLLEWRLREDKYQLPTVGPKSISIPGKGTAR